jgi:hypothetical protein
VITITRKQESGSTGAVWTEVQNLKYQSNWSWMQTEVPNLKYQSNWSWIQTEVPKSEIPVQLELNAD